MNRLFDASSLVGTILEGGGAGLEALFDQHVLDLTFYEAGNVLWKACSLQQRIRAEECDHLVTLLDDLQTEVEVSRVVDLPLDRTMTIATDSALTFYDAAYVARAELDELELVTEDGLLRERAMEYVSVRSLEEL